MSILVRAVLGALAAGCAVQAYAQLSPAQTIRPGETVRGVLEKREVHPKTQWITDVFTLRGGRGEKVTINLTSTSFDPLIHVDRGDTHVDEDDDGGDGFDARLVVEFEVSEPHQIYVTSSGKDETGAYTLKVERGGEVVVPAQTTAPRAARPAPPAAPIRAGQTLQGRMTPLSPLHTDDTPYMPFAFTARRNQTVTFDMTSEDFDTNLMILLPGATEELAKDDDSGVGTGARLTFTFPADGVYEIRANSILQSSEGDFSLAAAEGTIAPVVESETEGARSSPVARRPIAPPARSAPLAVGDTLRGTLETSDLREGDGVADAYRIRGQARQTVLITMTSDAFDAQLLLLDGAGNTLAENDDEDGTNPAITYTLPTAGDYYVIAKGIRSEARGAYRITLSREATAPAAR